jgi:hypothetical protein
MKAIYAVCIVVGVAIVLVVLSKTTNMGSKFKSPDNAVKQLINQSIHYLQLSEQDKSPLQRLLHLNYANAYVRAAMLMADGPTLNKICQRDVSELFQSLQQRSNTTIEVVVKMCPKLRTSKDMLKTGYIV